MCLIMAASAQAATTLNFTTFTESVAFRIDGNVSGYGDNGTSSFDTINGWTWGSNVALAGSPATQGVVFSGLTGIKDQEIRVGTDPAASELNTVAGNFSFGYGGSPHAIALAQAFTHPSLSTGFDVTVNYDLAVANSFVHLWIDNGSGSYTDAGAMANSTTGSYTFTATGSTIRVAVRGNQGGDSDGVLNSIGVTVPEPSAALLGGLGLLALLRRRRA